MFCLRSVLGGIRSAFRGYLKGIFQQNSVADVGAECADRPEDCARTTVGIALRAPPECLARIDLSVGRLPEWAGIPENQAFFWSQVVQEPSLGLAEFSSIAVGIKTCDRMLKSAPVHLLEAKPICPGRFMVLVHGDAVSVEYAMAQAHSAGEEWVCDTLYLPRVDGKIIATLSGVMKETVYDSLGVVETRSVASIIEAADIMAKITSVEIFEIKLAKELGGKSYAIVGGALGEVEASLEAAAATIADRGKPICTAIIPVPDEALLDKMGWPKLNLVTGGGENVVGF